MTAVTLQASFGAHSLKSVPIIFSVYCERGKPQFICGVVYAHSVEDLQQCLDCGAMRSMGIAWP